MKDRLLKIGEHKFWIRDDQDTPDAEEKCTGCRLAYEETLSAPTCRRDNPEDAPTIYPPPQELANKLIQQRSDEIASGKKSDDGIFIRTVIAIKQIATELKKDRFTAKDIYTMGRKSAIIDDRDVLWSIENVETITSQLVDAHDTVKYDNELFQGNYNAYRLIKQDKPLRPATEILQNYSVQAGHVPSSHQTGIINQVEALLEWLDTVPSYDEEGYCICSTSVARTHIEAIIAELETANARANHAEKILREAMRAVAFRSPSDDSIIPEHPEDFAALTSAQVVAAITRSFEPWARRAQNAENTIAELNQIIEEAVANENK